MVQEDIPGSAPDWRAANIKGKGRAHTQHVPPSLLGGTGAGGLAGWSTGSPASPPNATRRHFHHLLQAQTRAWDCLPCVDTAHKPPPQQQQGSTAGGSCGGSTVPAHPGGEHATITISASGGWRRHRRMVPAPPCYPRPEGKRVVLQRAAASLSCADLLKDPPPPAASSEAAAAAAAAAASAAACAGRLRLLKMDSLPASSDPAVRTAASAVAPQPAASAPAGRPAGAAAALPPPALAIPPAATVPADTPVPGSGSSSSSSSTAPCTAHNVLDAVTAGSHGSSACRTNNASSGSSSSSSLLAGQPCRAPVQQQQQQQQQQHSGRGALRRGGRVEDDPDYFRTPQDPPTLQRFVASLPPPPAPGSGAPSTAQRHAAGLRARQQAQLAADARDVAALEWFGPASADSRDALQPRPWNV